MSASSYGSGACGWAKGLGSVGTENVNAKTILLDAARRPFQPVARQTRAHNARAFDPATVSGVLASRARLRFWLCSAQVLPRSLRMRNTRQWSQPRVAGAECCAKRASCSRPASCSLVDRSALRTRVRITHNQDCLPTATHNTRTESARIKYNQLRLPTPVRRAASTAPRAACLPSRCSSRPHDSCFWSWA